MKMLVSRTPVSTAAPFELELLKTQHLKIDHSDDDPLIENAAWTAVQEIEQFAQLALLTQAVRVVIFDPDQSPDVRLPIGPVADGASVAITMDGEAFTDFTLVDGTRAMIRLGGTYYDKTRFRITIEYQAGFGGAATDIPRDLAQAVMDQASILFDGRGLMDKRLLTTSPHMARIGARYRGVQV